MTLYGFLQFSVCVFSILAATSRLAKPATKSGRQGAGVFPHELTSQSRWNAAGAVCAGTAAFSQSVAAMLLYVS
jgi:hypothetical protein